MIRLFVGLELAPALRARLADLEIGLPGAHWVPEDNLHLTLRFIGEVNEDTANDLHDALLGVRGEAFTLSVTGTGTFETGRRPHTLWAGVAKSDPLARLQGKIETALVRAGCEREARKFMPHITLARLKGTPMERLHPLLAAHALVREEMPVDHFTLFSSRLGSGDPVYTAEAEYPLHQ
jgi:2'-5' RNA ligase